VIEYDPQVAKLHRALYPQIKVIVFKLGESLHEAKAKIKTFFPSKFERRSLYMHATPPCQLLSTMNRLDDVREGMRQVHWSIDLFERLHARFLTIENVPKMHKYFFRKGYKSRLIVASGCSATPQARKRAIITDFKFKSKSHGLHIPASLVLPHTSMSTTPGSSAITAMNSR
jgi:site-specific DNA-cytosine methylase